MYKRKSTKGIKRGPYRKSKTRFDQEVAEILGNRLTDLGITQTSLVEKNEGKISMPTLSRILNGNGGTNINTLATVADMLGLEIIFKPKENIDNDEFEN